LKIQSRFASHNQTAPPSDKPRIQERTVETTPSIAIVTDSASGIPQELVAQYGIQVVPYWVHMGDESFVSGVSIAPEEFFRRLRAAPDLEVHTGVPAVAKFIEAYQRAAAWAESIVAIHVAGKQSGTLNAAVLASQSSPIPVVVLDTETTAMAEGFVVLEAARIAAAGGTLEQVVSRAKSVIPHVNLVALLESVSYALKGGRLSIAAGRVGSMLNIQPLIRVQGNRVGLMGQARRRSKGLETLVNRTLEDAREDPTHLTVHYAEDEDEGQGLLQTLKSQLNCVESYLTRVPVELGVHAGPGSIGVAYYVERETPGLVQQLEQQIGRIGAQAREAIRSRRS
jgi:DegV family protein with EDD domain